jgi:AcrR family transcriptional regulator
MANDKKEFLTRIAIDLFAKKGFSVTTMRDIANTAKVNVALIYYYFKDKEDILYHIIERSTHNLTVILREIQLAEADPFECLKKMIIRQVLYSSQSWKETKVITIDAEHLHGKHKSDCKKLQREVYDIYMAQLQRMKVAGYLGEINPVVVNFAIFGMISWFYRWYTEEKLLTEEDVAKEMVKILEFGILKKKSGKNADQKTT